MQFLYIRPVIELVAVWAENAWQMQSEGEFASSTDALTQPSPQLTQTYNPHSKMVDNGQINPSSIRRKLCTEGRHSLPAPSFILAPQLLAVHLEQSVSILADHGHALLRLAWRNYSRPTMTANSRDALTEYMGAHLLVAETRGKVSGFPEGRLGRCCGEWRMRKMEIFVKAKMMEMGTVKKRKR